VIVARKEVALVELEGSVGAGQAVHGSVIDVDDELQLELEL
jgi:hypothetical protein